MDAHPDTTHPSTVEALARALRASVPVHLPGSAEHTGACVHVDRVGAGRPSLVAVPRTPDEVALVVRAAGEHGVPVVVQGTGHGASAPVTGAVLVSTAALDHCTVLPVLGVAHVGAGARWSEVVAAAAPYGLVPVCGSSTAVSVGGYLTGGGHGPLARALGVSSDRVRAFDVVTGDGVRRRASAVDEPDLFWGLRGGRGALGIVVGVEVDLVDLPEVHGGALWSADVARVVPAWASWAQDLPPEATTSLAVARLPRAPGVPAVLVGRTTVAVRFAWAGNPDDGRRVVEPLRAIAAPLLDTVRTMPCSAVGTIHTEPDEPAPVHLSHRLLEVLGPAAAAQLVDLVGPGSPCAQTVVEVRQLGGAVARQPDVPDAVPSRAAEWSLMTVGRTAPGTAARVAADAERVIEGMSPWTRPGGLPNLTPGHGRAWAERVYPAPTRTRLAQLSRRYDPDGILLAGHAFRTR